MAIPGQFSLHVTCPRRKDDCRLLLLLAQDGNTNAVNVNASNMNAGNVNAANTNAANVSAGNRENATAENCGNLSVNATSMNADRGNVFTASATGWNMNAARRRDVNKKRGIIYSAKSSGNSKEDEIMKSIFRLCVVICVIAVSSAASFAGVSSVSGLKSAKVGVLSGSVSEHLAAEIVSGDTGSVIAYETIGGIINALRSKDVDAAIMDETPARYFASVGKEFRILAEPVESEYYAIAFKKGNPLRDEVDKALDAIIADKTLAGIMDKYITGDPDPAEIDMNRGANGGKLWVGCAASFPPYEMRTSRGFAGIDIELCAAIARRLDKELVIADYRFDALAEALESGKVDMICSALAVTEERMRTMDFTKPYDANQEVVLVLADGK